MSLDRPIARPIAADIAQPMTGRVKARITFAEGTGPVTSFFDGTTITFAQGINPLQVTFQT